MDTLKTCPACHYTRKATDNGPEWACPQCQKVYYKIQNIFLPNSCINHPSEKSTWRCRECGNEFCKTCVSPVQHSSSYFSNIRPMGSCPECQGICLDYEFEEGIINKQLINDKKARNKQLKILLGSITFTIMFFVILAFLPFEFRFLFGLIWVAIMLVLVIFAIFEADINSEQVLKNIVEDYFMSGGNMFDDDIGNNDDNSGSDN